MKKSILDIAIGEKNKSLKASFKGELNDSELKALRQAIKKHFLFKPLHTHHGNKIAYTFADLDNILGLAYTSSSSYAGLWVCNTELYSQQYKGYHYIGFAMSADNKPFAILWDTDENEILLPL